jgi:transcriptional regulator with XRE-family HTH domain
MNELRTKRIEQGLSLRDVAEAVGVTRQSISLYETGQIVPRWNTRQRLYRVLGLTSPDTWELTVYSFADIETRYVLEEQLKECLQASEVHCVERDIITFYVMHFDTYDSLQDQERTWLQEHTDGYYILNNRRPLEQWQRAHRQDSTEERIEA